MRSLDQQPLILIADRNPHVRGYLKREMMRAGYRIALAGSCREALEALNGSQPVDALVIDPCLPGAETAVFKKTLKACPQPMPIIVHALVKKAGPDFFFRPEERFVEKGGDSADQLKRMLDSLFEPGWSPTRSRP